MGYVPIDHLPVHDSSSPSEYQEVNRLIIIGNGFDLAHGYKTSFKDFLLNYSYKIASQAITKYHFEDELIAISNPEPLDWSYVKTPEDSFNFILTFSNKSKLGKVLWKSELLKLIFTEIEAKNWVDIEIAYFDLLIRHLKSNEFDQIKALNEQLEVLKQNLIKYLQDEVPSSGTELSFNLSQQFIQNIQTKHTTPNTIRTDIQPSNTCVLNFNYTDLPLEYLNRQRPINWSYIPIHGQLNGNNIQDQGPVFGFGDELDRSYLEFEQYRDDELFKHIKSFKYLQFSHYRDLLEFIEINPYQVYIFGHSCGVSDRTLLNTIFEHENCISIRPFYHKHQDGDDFEQRSFAISRNFKDKAKMRAKVVNKENCEPMAQPRKRHKY